jgi:disulfide bond formation protein DsbB
VWKTFGVTHAVTVLLSVLGVFGQVLLVGLVVVLLLRLVGVAGPLASLRSWLWGYELWLAFLVSGIATAGSLFFSEVANFVPCEMCWYQRIFMYPLAIVTLQLAIFSDYRPARYLLPLPVLGAGFSVYHLLIEQGVVKQSQTCLISAPGGCATKWINEFGYVTIPVLALTAFALTFSLLVFATLEEPESEPTTTPHTEPATAVGA